jgi:hypothetical protein
VSTPLILPERPGLLFPGDDLDFLIAHERARWPELWRELSAGSDPLGMAAVKLSYGTQGQAITITLNSLASSQTVGRASTAVDNTSNLYLDALVSLILPLGAGTPANDKATYVYAYGTTDGSNYSEGVSGSDASFTINNPSGLKMIGVIPMPTGGITYNGGPYSVAQAFGGVLPEKWGIVVVNYSGLALASSGCSANYQGASATVA